MYESNHLDVLDKNSITINININSSWALFRNVKIFLSLLVSDIYLGQISTNPTVKKHS